MSTRRSRVAVRRRELILAPACAAGLPGLLSAQPTRSATVGVLGAFRHNAYADRSHTSVHEEIDACTLQGS